MFRCKRGGDLLLYHTRGRSENTRRVEKRRWKNSKNGEYYWKTSTRPNRFRHAYIRITQHAMGIFFQLYRRHHNKQHNPSTLEEISFRHTRKSHNHPRINNTKNENKQHNKSKEMKNERSVYTRV